MGLKFINKHTELVRIVLGIINYLCQYNLHAKISSRQCYEKEKEKNYSHVVTL